MNGNNPSPDPPSRVVRQLSRVLKLLLFSLGVLLVIVVVQVAANVLNMDSSVPDYLLRERKAETDSLAAAALAHPPSPAPPPRQH